MPDGTRADAFLRSLLRPPWWWNTPAVPAWLPDHLLSGLHEVADVIESTNGGITWPKVGSGSVGGGVSVYPFFIDMGNAAATRNTWFAIGRNGSSPGRTTNGGASGARLPG
jgi:hypothetical protein